MATPGQNSSQKHTGHGRSCKIGIDDKWDRGRDDGSYHRGCQGDGCRKITGVSPFRHGLNLDDPEACTVGHSRSGNPGKDHACHHNDLGQPSPNVSDEGHAKVEDLVGKAGVIHHEPGEDEEGNRQQGGAVNPLNDLQRDHIERTGMPSNNKTDGRRDPQRHGNRDSRCDKDEEKGEEDNCSHRILLSMICLRGFSLPDQNHRIFKEIQKGCHREQIEWNHLKVTGNLKHLNGTGLGPD